MYKMILFDVDGVLLSEERYFDVSALTVWEMLYSPKYLGLKGESFLPAPREDEIRRIRSHVFHQDKIFSYIKSKGINANWDMVYLSFSHQLICVMESIRDTHKEELAEFFSSQITRQTLISLAALLKKAHVTVDFQSFIADFEDCQAEKQALMLYLNDIAERKLGIKTEAFCRSSMLWDLCQETFQEWYLGDELVSDSIGRETYQQGKKGFLNDEIPIVDPIRMADVFSSLKNQGIILGIGTGRPTIETVIPLEEMGLLQYFDRNRVVTASHVLDAETRHPERTPLAKPQPYSYIKGWLGLDASDQQCFDLELPLAFAKELLIVGDSVADYMAARSIGCDFAATLTGLSGHEARETFEKLEAEYICNDMTDILSIIHNK